VQYAPGNQLDAASVEVAAVDALGRVGLALAGATATNNAMIATSGATNNCRARVLPDRFTSAHSPWPIESGHGTWGTAAARVCAKSGDQADPRELHRARSRSGPASVAET